VLLSILSENTAPSLRRECNRLHY